MNKERRKGRRLLSAILSFVLILTMACPSSALAAGSGGNSAGGGNFFQNAVASVADFFGFGDADTQTRAATAGDGVQRTADTDTTQAYTLGEPDSTQYDGRVWVDKSVSAENTVQFGDKTVTNDSDFLVTYSALATSTVTVGQTPTDTVFILDLSASMTWGYDESGKSVPEDESRLTAMVDSVNSAIDTLVKANPDNHIAIVTFNGSCTEGQALIPELISGREILKKVKDSTYLDVRNYDQNLGDGKDKATADVYCAINGHTASTSGGTNIQAGLFRGMSILAENTDTTYTLDNGEEVTRIPNVILMSDGAPTTFSSAENAGYMSYDTQGSGENHYYEEGGWQTGVITADSPVIRDTVRYSVQSGSWWETNSGQQIGAGNNNDPDSADGFMALLTASYFKNAISDNYYGNSGEEANVYTIGFGTDVQQEGMVAMANLVLNPGENLGKTTRYDQVDEVADAWEEYQGNHNATVHAAIGDGSNTLSIPFRVAQCTDTDNNPTSLDYPTQYFAAADDEDLDQIFEEIASMITSSASAPTEVTGDPINDGYITYTDTTGQYMEIKNVKTLIFMDQELNVTKDQVNSTPDRAVYVAADYNYDNPAYPGQSFNTNQIEIVVTDNADNTQTINVKVPAALIPLRTNTVTLDGNGNPTDHEVSDSLPLRLCYEVGLAEGIDAETLDGVDAEYIKNNSENGKVNFYSNAYTENGQTNKGVGAAVEFEPSPTNPFYFVQEDTPLYVADGVGDDGNPKYTPATGDLDPDATYYVPMTYYDGKGAAVKKITTYAARSGETLEGYTDSNADGLYLKAGSPRLGNLQDVTASKSANETGTYGNYREPTFVYDQGSTNPQDGHFLVLLGNNGKLSVPFVKKDVSLTSDTTHASIDGQMVGIGETLHYTIDWVNTAVDQKGDPAAGTVRISDTLPAGTTYVEDSAKPAGAVYDKESNTLTWTIEADAGAGGTVEFDAVVGPAAVGNEDNALPNNAVITVSGNEYTTNTTVNYVPEKSVFMPGGSGGTTGADGETVMPGTELTYTIEYRNTENAEATVTITDVVPEGTTFVSATGNPTTVPEAGQTGDIEWTISNVAAGETGSVSFTVKVDNSAVTTVENEANVQVGEHDPAVTNKVTTNVDRASLIIEKKVTADPGLTAPDKEFEFELTIPSKTSRQIAAVIHTEGKNDQTTSLSFNADGKATFKLKADQSLEIPGMGNTRYSVVEKDAANGGFTLKEVKGAAGASSENNDQPVNDVNTATAAGTVGSDDTTVTFTNNYSVASATTTELGIDLGGTKNIDGRDFQPGDAFTFTIAAAQATPNAPLPKDTEVTINPASGDSATFEFGEITFDKPGEYRYIIQEVNYDTDNNEATENPGGISYDAAIYRVNIVIVDNGDGTLRLATLDEIKDISTQGGLKYTSNPMVQVNKGQDSSMTGADNNAVVFTNTYNADATTASIQGTKKLTVSNSDYTLEDGDFKFTIEALGSVQTDPDKTSYSEADFMSDNSQPMPVDSKGDPVTEAVNIANGNVSFQFAQNAFTKDMIGKTFGYKITESAGDIMSSGITYDPNTSRIVWITVSDDGHGNVTAAVMPDDGVQQANNFTFNNSYMPEDITIGDHTTAGITVQKTFTGHVWTDEYEFQFKIEPVSTTADGVAVEDMPMPDSDTISIGAPQSGTINMNSFGKMTFSKVGEYIYKITELDDNNAGTTCADADQTVTVNVTEDKTTGKLTAKIVYENNQQNAAFTNTYAATGGLTLGGTKTLKGRDWIDGDDFTFTLTGKNVSQGADENSGFTLPDPAEVTVNYNNAVAAAGEGQSTEGVKVPFSFGEITFSQTGTYEFAITESGYDDEPNVTNTSGTSVTFTYTVTDDGNGNLTAIPVQASQTGTSDFVNTYDPGNAIAGLTAVKTVNGESKGIAADMFTFKIEAVSAPQGAAADLPTNAANGTVKNGEDGAVDFGTFTFDTEGDYVYKVTEVNEGKAGYGYDDVTYTVVFHVSDDPAKGTLAAAHTIYQGENQTGTPVEAITFANTYHPEAAPATAAFSGTKSVTDEHGEFMMEAGQFSFSMTNTQAPAGVTAPVPGNGSTVSNGDDGNFSFGTLTFTEPGEYTYTVSEVKPTDPSEAIEGITYDGTQYTLYFNVVDDNGTLKVETQTITSSVGDNVDAGALNFTNIYNDGQVDYQITGIKILDTNGFSGAALAEGQFSFVLTEDGNVLQTATNGTPAGNSAVFAFDPITYTEPGTHTYTVYEIGTDGGKGTGGTDGSNITYSEEVYTVTVVVSQAEGDEGEHGGLSVSADVQNKDIVFTNEYVPAEVTVGPNGDVQIGGTKTLEVADGSQREMKEGEFTFLLLEGDQEVDRVTNAADGSFVFDDITYDKTGTYYYTVSEINSGSGGIGYDSTLYSVVVEVTENTSAHELEAEVTCYNTADIAAPVDGMTFTNSYEASPAYVRLGVAKNLKGAELEEGQFTFTLTGNGGAPMPEKDTVRNAADGSVLFGTITFDSVGEYDYTITEVNDGQEGIIYDKAPDRTVHVSVTDNGSGSLEAKVTYGADGAVITNTAEITPPSDNGNDGNDGDTGTDFTGEKSVQTGDTAQVFLILMVLLGAFVVIAATGMSMIRRRRK